MSHMELYFAIRYYTILIGVVLGVVAILIGVGMELFNRTRKKNKKSKKN